MIQARNTYKILVDRSTAPTKYTLALYIWKGDKLTPPLSAEYSITINNYELLTTDEEIEISGLVRDFIEQDKPKLNELNNFNSPVWCQYKIFLDEEVVSSQEDTFLFVDGYNVEDKNILLDGDELTVYDTFLIPFKQGSTYTVLSYPNSEINLSIELEESEESSEQIQIVKISKPNTDKYISVTDGIDTIYLYPELSTYKGNRDVTFINSFGTLQTIPFFGEIKESIRVESKEFKGGVNSSGHYFTRFNTNGRNTIKLKSGYHTEETNKALESLLLSEYIWIGSDYTPVNIDTVKLDYKTLANEKVVSYDITFKESFNKINRS